MKPYQGNLLSVRKGVKVLETEVGAVFALTKFSLPLEQNSLHTQLSLFLNLFLHAHTHTHISHTTLIVGELLCVVRVYLWRLLVLPLCYHRKANTQQ